MFPCLLEHYKKWSCLPASLISSSMEAGKIMSFDKSFPCDFKWMVTLLSSASLLNLQYGYVSGEGNLNEVSSAWEQLFPLISLFSFSPSSISILCSWVPLVDSKSTFSEPFSCKYLHPFPWPLVLPSPLFGPPPSHSWRRKSGWLFASSIAIDCCPLSFWKISSLIKWVLVLCVNT